MDSIKMKVKCERFFNNADLLLPIIKDSDGKSLKEGIELWLFDNYELKKKTRTEKGIERQGYDAEQLNTVLREKMNIIKGIHGESLVEYGAILTNGKKGFDFSLFDEEYNIIKLRNTFIGNPGRYNGEDELYNIHKYVYSSEGKKYKKREWKSKINSLGGNPGVNIECKKSRYTVVGEIQFGNWAIVRHDFLRLLNASIEGEIDYYVYITAAGDLLEKLSSGIASFDEVVNVLEENKNLIRTPVWVIGIDINKDDE